MEEAARRAEEAWAEVNNIVSRRCYVKKCNRLGIDPLPGVGNPDKRNTYVERRARKLYKPKRENCNTNKVKGVTFDKSRGTYRAYVKVDGKYKTIGRFLHWDKAVECVRSYAR